MLQQIVPIVDYILKNNMKLKIICCYALFIIITGARDTGNKKSVSIPTSVNIIKIPGNTTDPVNGAATGTTGLWSASFGGNAGN